MNEIFKFLLISISIGFAICDESWRFITLADWHGGEGFVKSPGMNLENGPVEKKMKLETLQYLKKTFGGELVMLPGDSNGGHWDGPEMVKRINESNLTTTEDIVLKAGDNCYRTIRLLFKEGGYPTMLMTTGDHEYGGNPWNPNTTHLRVQPQFRETYQRNFNRDTQTGQFLFSEPIGSSPSRPLGTPFENTSYAYRYKNALFITLDAFRLIDDYTQKFWDKSTGRGGQGAVTCTIDGKHLDWLENVLKEARRDLTIKHIFVQAHVPVLQPVRKVNSSGQFMDDAEKSEFWNIMRKYSVDVYFAGEVHTNTATKDEESNIVQIVSRGNFFNNFLTVDLTDTSIHITSYNEIGVLPQNNNNYEAWGDLIIDKSGSETQILSSGSLELLDIRAPLIHFAFDEISQLENSRQVLALNHDDHKTTLVARKITIRGIECRYSMYNHGSFGQQYDAQVGNLEIVDGGVDGKAGRFNESTRVGIWGMGPHSGGVIMSYSLYFKTERIERNMVLLHMGSIFAHRHESKEHIMTLTLDHGIPTLYISSSTRLAATNIQGLADGEWHQIAISMPRKSAKLSELVMIIDGENVSAKVHGDDDYLFFSTNGRVSIGGYGQTGRVYDSNKFRFLSPYYGLIDEVFIWSKPLI